MKTRFDNQDVWVDANSKTLDISGMSTMHLLNVLSMFIAKPGNVLAMIVQDIESGQFAESPVWAASRTVDNLEQSIANATSMTAEELTHYALGSNLGRAIAEELTGRGVHLDNALAVLAPMRA